MIITTSCTYHRSKADSAHLERRWRKELDTLRSMGFDAQPTDLYLALLEQFDGDLGKVIAELTRG